jgi:hypothetical protein
LNPDQEVNVIEPLNIILGSGNLCAVPERDGRLGCRLFRVPSTSATAYEFLITADDMKAGSFKQIRPPYSFPFAVWRSFYHMNNRPMNDSEIFAQVRGSERLQLQLPARSIDVVDSNLRTLFSDRGAKELVTVLVNRDQVLDTARERLSLYGAGRRCFEMVVFGLDFRVNVLSVVRIVHPRYELSDGQNFLAYFTQEESRGFGTMLRVWG